MPPVSGTASRPGRIAAAWFFGGAARSLDDWQQLYDYLRVRIYQDGLNEQSPGDKMKWGCEVCVRSMEVYAKDRDEVFQYAQEAQASKDPNPTAGILTKDASVVW
jgi:hypothetical protein